MRFKLIITLLLCSFFWIYSSTEGHSATEEARQFVDNISDRVLMIISDGSLSDKDKEKELSNILRSIVDTDWMGRFALGRYYRQASEADQEKYLRLYNSYIVQSYVPRFREYTGEKIQIDRIIEDEQGVFLVQTSLKPPGDRPEIRVDYRLMKNGIGELKVIDVIGEGISLITTQRSDFGGLISRKGFAEFLQQLQNKVNSYARQS